MAEANSPLFDREWEIENRGFGPTLEAGVSPSPRDAASTEPPRFSSYAHES